MRLTRDLAVPGNLSAFASLPIRLCLHKPFQAERFPATTTLEWPLTSNNGCDYERVGTVESHCISQWKEPQLSLQA